MKDSFQKKIQFSKFFGEMKKIYHSGFFRMVKVLQKVSTFVKLYMKGAGVKNFSKLKKITNCKICRLSRIKKFPESKYGVVKLKGLLIHTGY